MYKNREVVAQGGSDSSVKIAACKKVYFITTSLIIVQYCLVKQESKKPFALKIRLLNYFQGLIVFLFSH